MDCSDGLAVGDGGGDGGVGEELDVPAIESSRSGKGPPPLPDDSLEGAQFQMMITAGGAVALILIVLLAWLCSKRNPGPAK